MALTQMKDEPSYDDRIRITIGEPDLVALTEMVRQGDTLTSYIVSEEGFTVQLVFESSLVARLNRVVEEEESETR